MEMALGKRGPQDFKAVFPNGSAVQWQEGGRAMTAQIWCEEKLHHVWLLLSQGSFPGEMRLAKHTKGVVSSVDPTVYSCRGTAAEDSEPGETACVQGELFKYEAPEPPALETLPLF